MDLFQSGQLDESVAFCRNTRVYNVRNGDVIELAVVVSIPKLLGHGTGLISPKLHYWQNLNIKFQISVHPSATCV